MKKSLCWTLCAALIAPVIAACCGCDRPAVNVPPADVKAHMSAKAAKEASK
jgi:hypothetical protein